MRASRLSRGAWVTLLLALLLLALNIGQLAYRFTLPTDGWFVIARDVDNADWEYVSNLVGAPSNLMRGDALFAVDNVSVQGTATEQWLEPPPQWQVGNQVTYHVKRGDTEMAVMVPVVHWTPDVFWRVQTENVVQAGAMLANIFLLAIAWFTFLRSPEVPAARALLLFATGIAGVYISGMLPDGISVEFNQPAFVLTLFFSYAIYAILVGPAIFAFSLFFPTPKKIFQRIPWLAWLPVGMGLAVTGVILLFSLGILNVTPSYLWLFALANLIGAVIALVHSAFTTQDPVGRAQLRWAGSAFVVGILFFVVSFPPAFGWVSDPVAFWLTTASTLASPIIVLGLAIAILRYRLFDIDIIIRRTAMYAVLVAILVLVYFGSVVVLQQLFVLATGQRSEIITILSTLAIAALFVPLRNRVRDVINQRFNRNKYNAQKVLQQFGETVRDETDLDKLTGELVHVVQETMQPKSVSLWLKADRRGK